MYLHLAVIIPIHLDNKYNIYSFTALYSEERKTYYFNTEQIY